MPLLYHLQAVFLSDPLPGMGVQGLGDIIVDPEKTADCEYVNL